MRIKSSFRETKFRAISALLLITAVVLTLGAAEVTLRKPKLVAVKFHADWCPACKAMDFLLEDLADKFDGKPVLFITLDVTNQTTSHHSELLASALGVDGLWAENAGKTGIIYILRADTKKVVGTIDQNTGFESSSGMIDRALKE